MNKLRIQGMLSMKRTQMGESWRDRYDGYVYLAHFQNLGLYKIGHTRSMKQRLHHFARTYGERPNILHMIKTNWPFAAEQILIAGCELEPVIGREAGRLKPEAVEEIKRMLHLEIESPKRNEFAVKTTWSE